MHLHVAPVNLTSLGRAPRKTDPVGAKSRLRPMFMLIVAAMLGMIPAGAEGYTTER